MSIVNIRIPETVVGGKRLGRHIRWDDRSRDYPAETASDVTSVVHKSFGLPLDQGDVGSCTGEAVAGALNTVPHVKVEDGQPVGHLRTQDDAYSLYHDETVDEGEPWPPNDPGGTGLEVCKIAKRRGWLRGYTHAFGVDHALRTLVVRPVMTGVNWYDSFDTPDENGIVEIANGARVRGGHEFFANEIDAVNELVWFPNSWGGSFGVVRNGVPGCFAMRFPTWDTLLQQGGDVTVPLTKTGWNL